MLTVYTASAGSGKTYTLTKEYLMLLFKHQNAFKNTLAVTFTNKASGEMKERIINQLYQLSIGGNSSYTQEIMNNFSLSKEQVIKKAEQILQELLHNYSYFL
ncbi:MAG: UvrD-helicase domain-containing protein [Bacteroidales bacterium]|nr:UvrD-helicase domain-containing protein [Bacteroidales bacterium]